MSDIERTLKEIGKDIRTIQVSLFPAEELPSRAISVSTSLGYVLQKLDALEAEIRPYLAEEDKCFECTSEDCVFNNGGMCLYARVYGDKPRITEKDGCLDFEIHDIWS